MNRFELTGAITEIEPLRHTPAGLPLIKLVLSHSSELTEAGFVRKLNMQIRAVAIGTIAQQIAKQHLGQSVHVVGFLAPVKKDSDFLIFHIQELISTVN